MRRLVIVLALVAVATVVAFFPYTYLPRTAELGWLRTVMHDSGYTRAAEDGFRRVYPGFLVWIAFTLYWNARSQTPAPTQRAESRRFGRINGILWSTGLLLLFLPLPGLTWRFLPASIVWIVAGLVIQGLGTALALWARRELGREWSSEVRVIVDHRLVCSGPYQLVRHPIYTAMLVIFIGLAIQPGQLHGLAALPLFLFRYWRKIPAEEKLLHETFGAEYETYRRRTWALIPYLF